MSELISITSNIFSGENTYGKKVEVARHEDGTWFTRRKEYNGYGMNWSKWEEYPSFQPEVHVDEYDREVMKWGFNELIGFNSKVRLPK